MRLRADIYVSALVRRVFSAGDFAAVEKKGAEEAGAIFIRQRFRDGLETLYAPAPQSFFDEESSGDRLFEIRLERAEPEKVQEMLDRERQLTAALNLRQFPPSLPPSAIPTGCVLNGYEPDRNANSPCHRGFPCLHPLQFPIFRGPRLTAGRFSPISI
jgi:hypothetical protein